MIDTIDEIEPLASSISVLSGFPFPSAQFTNRFGKPLIRIRDLLGSKIETNFVGDFDPIYLISRDDILIGMDGDFSVVRWKGPEALLNQRVCKVKSASKKIDEGFLYWWLQPHVELIHHRTPQTTVRHLSVNELYRIPSPTLSNRAQAFAATVLDTVDEEIAKTKAVIAKLKNVRAGLLHDLITCGLNENGQLRDPIAHPEQFQDSLLGRIPREWQLRRLKECYEIPSRNGLYKKPSCYGAGYRMIHMPQMFKDIIIDVSDAACVAVDPQELQRYAIKEGDLLFARRSLNLEGAGLCSMVPDIMEPVTFESSIVRVRIKRDLVIPRFAVEFLRSPQGYLLRRRFIRQVAVSGVSSEDIGQFVLPCQKPSEQERILTVLGSYDCELNLSEIEIRKLGFLKSGLMADLLTGRVRVPEGVEIIAERQKGEHQEP
jgi:type I restriction enzyme S subunit